MQGFVGRALGDPGLKPTVRVGEAAMREVAAYLLDHENFARVPPTVLGKPNSPILPVKPSFNNGREPAPLMAHSWSGCVVQLRS